ncbi:hypothetical protein ACWEQJ_12850 [Streptomyces cyaneofuscatus]|uniref:hypothetical protein n=1 Tax=Streptomyces cyaneofuscatus TaxID=66883 RepID=UPI0033B43CF4
MTYDIMLVRIPADSTLHEAVDRLNADFDPDADPARAAARMSAVSDWARHHLS